MSCLDTEQHIIDELVCIAETTSMTFSQTHIKCGVDKTVELLFPMTLRRDLQPIVDKYPSLSSIVVDAKPGTDTEVQANVTYHFYDGSSGGFRIQAIQSPQE